MPKGQSRKIKCSICYIPKSKIGSTFKSLPRPADSNEIIVVKLKREVEYRRNVLFEADRPKIIKKFLNYLKANNNLYRDIETDMENLLIRYSNLQNGETEDNNKIYNYIMKNTTQPLDTITKNPVIKEIDSKNETSCNIASNNQNDCTTQSKKFST